MESNRVPKSTAPTSNSMTVPASPLCTPLYCIATLRFTVVDINPNSTPAVIPRASFLNHSSPSCIDPRPLKTLRPCGTAVMRDCFSTALTRERMDVVQRLWGAGVTTLPAAFILSPAGVSSKGIPRSTPFQLCRPINTHQLSSRCPFTSRKTRACLAQTWKRGPVY